MPEPKETAVLASTDLSAGGGEVQCLTEEKGAGLNPNEMGADEKKEEVQSCSEQVEEQAKRNYSGPRYITLHWSF